MKYKIQIYILILFILSSSHIRLRAEQYTKSDYEIYSIALNKLFIYDECFRLDSLHLSNRRYIFNKFLEDGSLNGICKLSSKFLHKYSNELSNIASKYVYKRPNNLIVDSFNLCFDYQIFSSPDTIPAFGMARQNNKDYLQKIFLPPVIYNKKHSEAFVLVYSFFSHELFEPEFGGIYLCYIKKHKLKWEVKFIKHICPGFRDIKIK